MRAPGPPVVSVFPNDRAAARALAHRIAAALSEKPRLVLGLPTGRTPVRFYHDLASLAEHGHADFSHATTFNLDEFLGLPAEHPASYRSFMNAHLFTRVSIDPRRINFLNGTALDPVEECARYERAIAEVGGIDVQILGLGANGHIGFNEPGPELQPRTHRVVLRPETRRANAALFGGDPAAVPAEALSMGMATILQARSIVLLATGRSKAHCIAQALRGPITPQLPASFLQLHHDVEVMLDEAAAAELKG
ncbi:MAG TPA: glucosamine-6-phosphate deaminase [Vicinamibacterales bacterium]|nr:glucosamine-6-phosphate deaminase [Vicinamibacterales bacterium]